MFERYRHHDQEPEPRSFRGGFEAIHEGMIAFSGDGYRLGDIIHTGRDEFVIERGHVFPKGWRVRRGEVKELKGQEVYLLRSREELIREAERVHARDRVGEPSRKFSEPSRTYSSDERGERRPRLEELSTNSDREQRREEGFGERRELLGRDLGREEMRIPIAGEELEVVKRENPRVAARVHKRVVTEIRELRVPIRREELVIERVPYKEGEGRDLPRAEFKEDNFVIPLVEEEIEIRKHPRVREEVILRKQTTTEERHLSEPVRRQVVEVERQTDLTRASGGHEASGRSDTYRH